MPAEEFRPPRGRPTGPSPDLDGVTAFRTHELRPGWVPSKPRGRRCSSRTEDRAQPAPAASQRPVLLTLLQHPIRRGPLDEASMRVQAIHPSGLPLACGRPDGTGRPWASPEASHPADQEPTGHAGVGPGHRARTWNNALRHQPNLPSCVFTQHVRPRVAPINPAVSAGWLCGAGGRLVARSVWSSP
jgi:hypothetical protein